jgi:RHH-type proline utilization regulon transcriptional repressor/proline dehydrogenase/delta 1-pyrroline-5-carboxylate dehydrogenase
VCFTGSHTAAKHIQRALAARDGAILPLIAETGGLNAMVADSSALLEQLCDDVIHSAFGSAGQRCSALRILYLPHTLADDALKLITGAMQQLRIGNPWDVSTDIGSVIDADAKAALEAHVSSLKETARPVFTTPLSDACNNGHFIAPQIWELRDASQLTQEAFGAILHVVRYDPKQLDAVYDQINRAGFGLTFGLHTRIQSRSVGLAERVRAGNLYINRGMTGAVVGVQPFGGEGLSGTGFKAGGEHYLLRFVNERTTSTNVAAIGGNIDLLMKS